MSGETHTPGPWDVMSLGDSDEPDLAVGAMIHNGMGIYTAYVCGRDRLSVMGNARLIAAAPDLYEALSALQLQALQSSVNHAGNEWGLEALAMTKAAIAKAEGRANA